MVCVCSGNWAHVGATGVLRLGMRGGNGPMQVDGGGSPTQEDNNRATFVVTCAPQEDQAPEPEPEPELELRR